MVISGTVIKDDKRRTFMTMCTKTMVKAGIAEELDEAIQP